MKGREREWRKREKGRESGESYPWLYVRVNVADVPVVTNCVGGVIDAIAIGSPFISVTFDFVSVIVTTISDATLFIVRPVEVTWSTLVTLTHDGSLPLTNSTGIVILREGATTYLVSVSSTHVPRLTT